MHGKYESYERPRKVRIPTPDWWTAIFSGILAVTAVAALWYARDQIKETREESEVEIKEARQQAQIQHLLTLVNEFDQEPMATYRRGFAQKRLSHKDDDPIELYRILDFFETVGLLVNRGYLNERMHQSGQGNRFWSVRIKFLSRHRPFAPAAVSRHNVRLALS